MGRELEVKYHIDDDTQLERVFSCGSVEALRQGEWELTPMETVYFDTPARAFSSRRWTLRHRVEGERRVACMKTPSDEPHARNEFEVEAPEMNEAALSALIAAGAPQEAAALAAAEGLLPVCGAKFIRKAAVLRFSDGSTAVLSGDVGMLHGAAEQTDFCELELELQQGQPEQMLRFAQQLAQEFALRPEPKSKHARAAALR